MELEMRRWQKDPDLAGIRDPAALAQLPRASGRSVKRSGRRCRPASTAPGRLHPDRDADRPRAIVIAPVESRRSDLDPDGGALPKSVRFARHNAGKGTRARSRSGNGPANPRR